MQGTKSPHHRKGIKLLGEVMRNLIRTSLCLDHVVDEKDCSSLPVLILLADRTECILLWISVWSGSSALDGALQGAFKEFTRWRFSMHAIWLLYMMPATHRRILLQT